MRKFIASGNPLLEVFSYLSVVTSILCLHMHDYLGALCCVCWGVAAYGSYQTNKNLLKTSDDIKRMRDIIDRQNQKIKELKQALFEKTRNYQSNQSNSNNPNN